MTPRTLQQPPRPGAQEKIAPEMPRIPEIKHAPPRARGRLKPLVTVTLAALVCATGLAVWLSHRRSAELRASAPSGATSGGPSSDASSARTARNPNAVANLPSPPAEPSFWAFSLTTPFSRCQLQYVTDLSALSRRFVYSADHPMVVSDCDGILYDPLKIDTLPDGSWVRGEIVRGGGIRPPIAIQIEVQGRDIVADRTE
ncbi:MAG: hypothetical protein DMG31_10975 [Acidobacteria bacterium]|nr:MAG: hypothetical protein DMG31_10975 [Acidobacteriota bacterium]